MLKFAALLLTILPLSNTLDRVEEARREGRYQEALTLLDQVKQESPESFRVNNLLYLQAVLQQQAGMKDEARQGFEAVRDSRFPLPDSVLLHLIDVTDGSDLDQRQEYFQAFLERFPTHPRWSSVALQYADLFGENNRDSDARRWYERLISGGRLYVRTSRLRVAQLLLKSLQPGDSSSANSRAEAIGILAKLVTENDHDAIALEAAHQLRKVEEISGLTEVDLRHRAMAFVSNHDGDTARIYLNRLVDRFPESAARPEYEYLIARSLYLEDRRKDAIAAYDRTYRKYPASEWGVYSRYLSGNLSLAFNDYQQAAAAFRDVTDSHADSEHFDRALIGLAEALVWLGDRAGAEQALTRGLSAPGTRSYAFQYQLARLKIEDGRYAEALSNLKPISQLTSQQLPSGVTREEVLFWKGFCEQQAGMAAESQQSYLAAANGRANYFGYLARQHVASSADPAPTASPTKWNEKLAPRAERIAGQEEQSPSAEGGGPIARLQELLFLRLYDEAYEELKRQGPRPLLRDKTDYLFQLATWAQRGGLFRQSLDEAEELVELQYNSVPPESYPPQLQRLLYPVPYWDLVVRFGAERRIDPYLLLALMKQESGFQPDAISPAAARGLMQLMPGTARELSRRLKVPFRGSSSLYRPEVSIQLGSLYFKQMLDDFGGVPEKALAAYNGGASNVRRWEKKVNNPDITLFVSNIGFRETKLYVLRVLGNYWTYRRLYSK